MHDFSKRGVAARGVGEQTWRRRDEKRPAGRWHWCVRACVYGVRWYYMSSERGKRAVPASTAPKEPAGAGGCVRRCGGIAGRRRHKRKRRAFCTFEARWT